MRNSYQIAAMDGDGLRLRNGKQVQSVRCGTLSLSVQGALLILSFLLGYSVDRRCTCFVYEWLSSKDVIRRYRY